MKQSSNQIPPEELTKRHAAKLALTNEGRSVSGWAREHQFNAAIVHAVLTGKLAGRYGEAYKVCVALGLKGQKATGEVA